MDPETKAANAKKAEEGKTPAEKAAIEKARIEKEKKTEAEKKKAESRSSLSYDLNDAENREVDSYFENQKKAQEKAHKSVFGFGL